MNGYLLVDPGRKGTGADQAAFHLAKAVSAEAKPVTELPDLSSAPVVGILRARVDSVVFRDNQVFDNPAEVARGMAVAIRAGSWVAAVTRTPKKNEYSRVRDWYAHRLGTANPTHHSTSEQTVLVTFVAGGGSREEVSSMLKQMVAVLPGFDVSTDTFFPSNTPLIAGIGGAAVLASAGLIAAKHYAHPVPPALAAVPTLPVVAGLLVLAAALIAGIVAGFVPTAVRRLSEQVAATRFDPPPTRGSSPKKPRKESVNNEGGRIAAHNGDYPLHRHAFLVGPGVLVGLIAPHAGASSGAISTARREAPATLLDPAIGPSIGVAGQDARPVHISAAAIKDGLGFVGRKGSGKSVLLRTIYAWLCMDRVASTRIPGSPGQKIAMVAFESKGAGAAEYVEWSKAVGDQTLLIDMADPKSFAIDIWAIPGSLTKRVNFIYNALVYCFEPGEIQGLSAESLTAVLPAALMVSSKTMRQVGLPESITPGKSPLYYAHLLLGAAGDGRAIAIAAAISEGAARAKKTGAPDAADLALAEEHLAVIFGDAENKVTPSARRNQTQAARNKIRFLLQAESWWNPKRPSVTWETIITGFRSVVINTGISASGETVDDKTTAYMSSLLMYSLRDAIQRHCNEWDAIGQHVAIISDELSLLAGSSPEVIAWTQDKGRSYGVIPIYATQRVDQLHQQVQKILRDFGTIFWFSQSDPEVARIAALDLSPSGNDVNADDIVNLPPYTAWLRTKVGGVRQPVVPVKLTNFEVDRSAFIQEQGGAPRSIAEDAPRVRMTK